MREVVIVSGVRTAIGDYMGSLSSLNAIQLGIIALKGAIAKAGIDKSLIQEVVAGHVNQAGAAGNSARHIALGVELRTLLTVHQQCPLSIRASRCCQESCWARLILARSRH